MISTAITSFGASAGEIQLVRGDFYSNDVAVLLLVSPFARSAEALRAEARDDREVFAHPQADGSAR